MFYSYFRGQRSFFKAISVKNGNNFGTNQLQKMILGSTPMFASSGSSFFRILELMTLAILSEMQYGVQNDRPCCRFGRKF